MTKIVQQDNYIVHLIESRLCEWLKNITCCTVEFPPFKMAIPSFKVAATIGPVSP